MQFRISGSPGKSFRGCSYIRLNLPTVWWQLGQEWMTSLHPSMQNGIRQQPSHKLKKIKSLKTHLIKDIFLKNWTYIIDTNQKDWIQVLKLMRVRCSPFYLVNMSGLTVGQYFIAWVLTQSMFPLRGFGGHFCRLF